MPDSSAGEKGYLDDLIEKPQTADVKPEAAAPSAAEGEKPAPSPSADAKAEDKPAEGAKAEPKSILDAVNAAIAKDKVQEQSPGSKTEKDKPADAPADADKAKDDVWDGKSPLNQHPRFKEIIAQRDSYKEKAESFDQFIGGVQAAGLNVGEFNQLLNVGALIKHDPAKALEQIEAVADQLRGIVGEKLQPALKKRVDDGEISEADAKAQSRAEARAARAEQRTQQTAEQAAFTRQQNHLLDCDRAGGTWWTQQAQADPDWSKKSELVRDEADLLLSKAGPPPTVQDAIKLLNVAKTRVENKMRAFMPTKARVDPPVKAGGASTQHAPAPKSLEEAIQRGLQMTAAG